MSKSKVRQKLSIILCSLQVCEKSRKKSTRKIVLFTKNQTKACTFAQITNGFMFAVCQRRYAIQRERGREKASSVMARKKYKNFLIHTKKREILYSVYVYKIIRCEFVYN